MQENSTFHAVSITGPTWIEYLLLLDELEQSPCPRAYDQDFRTDENQQAILLLLNTTLRFNTFLKNNMNWYTAWCTNLLYNFRHDVGAKVA